MRIPRLTHCLLALVCTLAGCTQTGGFRSTATGNSSSNIRTVASIGDKPIPIVAGEPGLSSRAETEEIDLPPSTGARISGRVYDERGRPVPNAKVRLAVGGSPSGKASYATTDRSGAFTLRGLRSGSYYTVIAEYQAQSGSMSGRIEAQAPDTNVRISLQSRDSESDSAHTTIRPAKSRVNATLDDDDDENSEDRNRADRYNSEDLGPPAAEATSMLPRGSRSAGRLSADDSLPPIRAGWNPRQRTPVNDAGASSQSTATVDEHGSSNSRNSSAEPVGDDDDEGDNPLPPALDPRKVGSTFPGDSGDEPPLKIATGRPRSSSQASRQKATAALDPDEPISGRRDQRLSNREPRPMPDGIVPNAREMRPDSFAPIRGTDPADLDNVPSRSLPRARRGASDPPAQTRPSRSSDSREESSTADPRSGDEAAARSAAPSALAPAVQTALRSVAVAATPSAAVAFAPSAAVANAPTVADTDTRVAAYAVSQSAADTGPPVATETASRPTTVGASRSAPDASTARRPTWRDLSFSSSDVPVDESVRLAANVAEEKGPPVVTSTSSTSRTRRSLFQRLSGSKPGVETTEVSQSFCRIDPTDRRVVDLRLPALDGKIVSFKDMNAELILFDFWGSWCKECKKSIPHLSELQARYGENRLRVIGVACERGSSLQERQASAVKAARNLKINYSVLVSSMDGSCPVQKGMQVQFYPTMVLLARDGRIIQREQGATDATLARIDRAVENALK